jgi:two-component system CheB/CheR fusion protein
MSTAGLRDSPEERGLERPGEARVPLIVAVGASAGGLEALRQLFAAIPRDTGMAFVVIQHLDPTRPSALVTVLSAMGPLSAVEVTDGMRAEANRIHVIPPGSEMSVREGVLTLTPRREKAGAHRPIDSFFRALADDQGKRAIGVVLSGSGSDGTDGLRAIKDAGGITFAQSPDSAQFRSMPASAIAAGVVEFSLPPRAIAQGLVALSRHPYVVGTEEAAIADTFEEARLTAILAAVRRHAGNDFRGYKRSTVLRRVARRIAVRRLGSVTEYAEVLRGDPAEARALADDILIRVTSFFRDPTSFEALKRCALAGILEKKDDDATVRVWVPGCSTGEEAYSLAMSVVECAMEQDRALSLKVFGTDLSEKALEIARTGLYAESDLADVAP